MTVSMPPQPVPDEQRTEHPHVTRSESILGGVPIIRGTRIPVRLIAQLHRAGDTVDDIVQSYPHLSAAAVYDAISYYLDHLAEIEAEIVAHRLENLLPAMRARVDEHGFITFQHPATSD